MGALLCWKQPAGSMKSWPPVVTSPMATALGGPLWALHRRFDRWAGRLQRYFGRTEMVSWLSVVPKFLWIGPVHHPWRLLMDPSHHPHRAAGCPVHHPWARRYITHGSAPLPPGKAARNTRARFNFSFFNYSISLTGPQLHKLREGKKCRPPACVSASRRAVPLRGPALCWEGPPVPKWMTTGLRPRALRALHPTRCPERGARPATARFCHHRGPQRLLRRFSEAVEGSGVSAGASRSCTEISTRVGGAVVKSVPPARRPSTGELWAGTSPRRGERGAALR